MRNQDESEYPQPVPNHPLCHFYGSIKLEDQLGPGSILQGKIQLDGS